MVQCSRHATPPAVSVILTDQQGHDLGLRLKAWADEVLTYWRLRDSLARRSSSAVDPH
jgi:hypothetical protein